MGRLGLSFAGAACLSFAIFTACASGEPSSEAVASDVKLGSAEAGNPSPSAAAQGAVLAGQLGCHGCHDSPAGVMAGNAAGVVRHVSGAGSVRIYPANLTPDSKTGIGTKADGWSDEQLARAIRSGVDDECLTLCKAMPHFDLSDDDMTAVIAYLRSLAPVTNDIANQGCPTLTPAVSGSGQLVDAGSCPAPEPDPADDAGRPSP